MLDILWCLLLALHLKMAYCCFAFPHFCFFVSASFYEYRLAFYLLQLFLIAHALLGGRVTCGILFCRTLGMDECRDNEMRKGLDDERDEHLYWVVFFSSL